MSPVITGGVRRARPSSRASRSRLLASRTALAWALEGAGSGFDLGAVHAHLVSGSVASHEEPGTCELPVECPVIGPPDVQPLKAHRKHGSDEHLAPVGKVHSQVGSVDFDLCQPQEREAPKRDRAEIRIVPRLGDLYAPRTGIECGPYLVQLLAETCQRLHDVLWRFARKGYQCPATLYFTTLGVVRHRYTQHCRTGQPRESGCTKSEVARDRQSTPFREPGGFPQFAIVQSAQGLGDASGSLHDRMEYLLTGRFSHRHLTQYGHGNPWMLGVFPRRARCAGESSSRGDDIRGKMEHGSCSPSSSRSDHQGRPSPDGARARSRQGGTPPGPRVLDPAWRRDRAGREP